MYTHIQKWGNSQAIRLPKPILETASIKEGESVQIFAEKDQIIIRRAPLKHKSLAERFEGYNGDYKCEEYDWGEPCGREVW